ncbi:MAG: nucleotidyltransferase family protein [Gemmatimonadales bacterium]|nr:MAG: nucleotidyltransferase family protein [Gemmatimonadales bacterium]
MAVGPGRSPGGSDRNGIARDVDLERSRVWSRVGRAPLKAHELEGALRLRSWALQLLLGESESAGAPPGEPPRIWDTFLRRERCAQNLLALRVEAGLEGLPDPIREVLLRNATRQAQRVLAGRGQLRRIGAGVLEARIPTVVLKGGAPVAMGEYDGDVLDLDLLVPPDRVGAMLGLLAGAGYQTALERGVLSHHETPRQLPELVPVEVHFGLPGLSHEDLIGLWERSQPVDGLPGIRVLASVDHAWHVFHHSSLEHPHRRGCIRDLLLLRDALRRCTAEERERLRWRAEVHRESAFLDPWLRMAEAAAGDVPHDAFQRVAAADYLFLGSVTPRRLPQSIVLPLAALTLHLLGERAGASLWSEAAVESPSARPFLRAMRRFWPPLERVSLFAIRLGRLAAMWPVAVFLARRVRGVTG